MYSLEIICKECGHILYFQETELWRIASISNDLEIKIQQIGLCCNICEQIGPMQFVARNLALNLVFFEKIISPTLTIEQPPTTKTIEELKKIYNPANIGLHKSTMNNPCILCIATGKIEVQYKAHKKEGSFKGVLTEECPACDGRGYFN